MSRRVLVIADAVADESGLIASPGAVVIEGPLVAGAGGYQTLAAAGARGLPRLVAVGEARDVEAQAGHGGPVRVDATVRLEGWVLLPAIVNAHAHLDLTSLGPRPVPASASGPGGAFVEWVRGVRSARGEVGFDPGASTGLGVARSRAGGVAAVGDIAGALRPEPVRTLRASGLLGVSFLECFGSGARQPAAIAQLRQAIAAMLAESGGGVAGDGRVRLGIQPHSPYSAGRALYDAAIDLALAHGLVLSTHLGETSAERRLVAGAEGPLRGFLEELGLWDAAMGDELGAGLTPVEHAAPALARAPFVCAHVNDADDRDIEILARTRASVAYCPRATDAMGHAQELGPHRYRAMLGAGVNVALGTDSILCLPAEECDRLSPLDDARYLFRRDGTDPALLLRMATTNGASALGLDPSLFRLGRAGGEVAGLIAVDVRATGPRLPALERVMRSRGPVRTLAEPRGLLAMEPGP